MRRSAIAALLSDDLVRMRIHGATPEFAREMQAAGFSGLTAEELVKFRIHRVTPEFVRAMADLGYKTIDREQIVKFRIHKVTPEFIRALADRGYRNVDADDLVKMRIHNVSAADIDEYKKLGYSGMDIDELVKMRIHRVTPSFIREIHELGYQDRHRRPARQDADPSRRRPSSSGSCRPTATRTSPSSDIVDIAIRGPRFARCGGPRTNQGTVPVGGLQRRKIVLMIDEFAARRERMVETQLRARGIVDPRVLDAMRRVPRHVFVHRARPTFAYGDHPRRHRFRPDHFAALHRRLHDRGAGASAGRQCSRSAPARAIRRLCSPSSRARCTPSRWFRSMRSGPGECSASWATPTSLKVGDGYQRLARGGALRWHPRRRRSRPRAAAVDRPTQGRARGSSCRWDAAIRICWS